MNDPGARPPGEPVPLDQRYTGADPIEWCGAAVYPMYTEALAVGTTAVRLRAVSVMPPADVAGIGLGLTVQDGHVNLDGRALVGVDIWSDALTAGVDISVTANAPQALFTLTPVWVAESGTQQSWTGNYGMVVDLLPGGSSTLWCSTGPGTPDFNELVVELTTIPSAEVSMAATAPALVTMPLTVLPPTSGPAVPAQPMPVAPPVSVAHATPQTVAPPDRAAPSTPHTFAPPASTAAATPQTAAPPDTTVAATPPTTAPGSAAPSTPRAVAPPVSAAAPTPPPTDSTETEEAAPPTAPMPSADSGQGIGRALYELGTAMRERGDHDSARALLAQAAEAGHRGAAHDLGALLLDAGDHAGAEKWWKAAAPDDPRAAASLSELTQRA
ncbi:tetratricopeptide repeat protein [Nocardia neocaledoniensis]|uniref:tetratricopeptide repeat protein n=1 Tax=Nocardia neocaledoniensis TaxID=236511 RepID=UPI002456E661|nr:tetratricopeptide repeat protein [Nocardia neocaledoniensis]